MTTKDLREGVIYYSATQGHPWKKLFRSRGGAAIGATVNLDSKTFNSQCKQAGCSSTFSGNYTNDFRLATSEEIVYFLACEQANAYIPQIVKEELYPIF